MYMLIDCRIQLTAQPTPGGCRFHFFQVHVHAYACIAFFTTVLSTKRVEWVVFQSFDIFYGG